MKNKLPMGKEKMVVVSQSNLENQISRENADRKYHVRNKRIYLN